MDTTPPAFRPVTGFAVRHATLFSANRGAAPTADLGAGRTAALRAGRTAALRAGRTAVLTAMAAVAFTGCAPAAQVPATPAPAPAAAPAPGAATTAPRADPLLAFEWVRGSAEHRAIYLEVFRSATVRLDSLAAGRPAGPWGIITDGDETIIDNSEYEAGRAERGLGFTEESWSVWVRRAAAPALPGARAFLERVHALGGRVVVVTNRREALCPVTRANLRKEGLDVDLVLCRRETSDKNPRFEAVQNGTASPDIPALHVLMWLGDNIRDFPHLSQSILQQPDGAFRDFGRIYFILPNPMYGSWPGGE
ncbi:MAG: HAD family acid phosphatase [Gemmatimonadota bacterium]